MITDFIDRVVIIDDKKEETDNLVQVLKKEDISVDVQLVNSQDKKLSSIKPLKKYRQIVFIDLSLDDSINIENNISTLIRPILTKILPKSNGCYGLVVWSKHIDDVLKLKEKLMLDIGKYCLPMFVVSFDKNKYLREGYDTILEDLNKELQNDKLAYFFMKWVNTIRQAAGNAIFDIYSLVPDYNKQKTELVYLLYKMALNHTGIPENQIQKQNYNLTTDAYKSFDELLYSDLINQLNKDTAINLFSFPQQNPWSGKLQEEIDIYSKLNTKLFIDSINIKQEIPCPGNVYELKQIPNKFCEGWPKNSTKICIELTPPCDFSHKKIYSKIICGFLFLPTKKDNDSLLEFINSFKGDNKYLFWPFEYEQQFSIMVFDFRCMISLSDEDLKKTSDYKVLFRVNHKLFADILQKYSSYSARLGMSNIIPVLQASQKVKEKK